MSGRGFATSVKAPGINVSMNSPLAGVALRSGLHSTEDNVESRREHFVEYTNHYWIKQEQLKKLMLEKNTSMNATSIFVAVLEKKVASIEIKKVLQPNPNEKLLLSIK